MSLLISLTVYYLEKESTLLQTVKAAMPIRKRGKVKLLFCRPCLFIIIEYS